MKDSVMVHTNIEIKARSDNHDEIREILSSHSADFKGADHQIDTYFKTNHGRLKLREGKLENFLIHYNRENTGGPKQSDVTLFKSQPETSLKEILTKSLGILVVVNKQREIYFIDNVKFHIDMVKGLGSFIEIEAIGTDGNYTEDQLYRQCRHYLGLFRIPEEDLLPYSYSDMLLKE